MDEEFIYVTLSYDLRNRLHVWYDYKTQDSEPLITVKLNNGSNLKLQLEITNISRMLEKSGFATIHDCLTSNRSKGFKAFRIL